jgi:hypothetical protein
VQLTQRANQSARDSDDDPVVRQGGGVPAPRSVASVPRVVARVPRDGAGDGDLARVGRQPGGARKRSAGDDEAPVDGSMVFNNVSDVAAKIAGVKDSSDTIAKLEEEFGSPAVRGMLAELRRNSAAMQMFSVACLKLCEVQERALEAMLSQGDAKKGEEWCGASFVSVVNGFPARTGRPRKTLDAALEPACQLMVEQSFYMASWRARSGRGFLALPAELRQEDGLAGRLDAKLGKLRTQVAGDVQKVVAAMTEEAEFPPYHKIRQGEDDAPGGGYLYCDSAPRLHANNCMLSHCNGVPFAPDGCAG